MHGYCVYACEKFNQYILEQNVIKVETDHKPIIPIFKKPLLNAPKRLQRHAPASAEVPSIYSTLQICLVELMYQHHYQNV